MKITTFIIVLIFIVSFGCKNASINSDQQSTIPAVKSTAPPIKRDYHSWSLAEKEAESAAIQSYLLIEENKWNLASR